MRVGSSVARIFFFGGGEANWKFFFLIILNNFVSPKSYRDVLSERKILFCRLKFQIDCTEVQFSTILQGKYSHFYVSWRGMELKVWGITPTEMKKSLVPLSPMQCCR